MCVCVCFPVFSCRFSLVFFTFVNFCGGGVEGVPQTDHGAVVAPCVNERLAILLGRLVPLLPLRRLAAAHGVVPASCD